MKIKSFMFIFLSAFLICTCSKQNIPDLQVEFSGADYPLGVNTVCDSVLVENGLEGGSETKTTLAAPVVIVINQYDTLDEVMTGKNWQYLNYVFDIPLCKSETDHDCRNYELDLSTVPISFDADEARTVVCICERSVLVGNYLPFGGDAYRVDWLVGMASWPEGEYLWSMELKGNDPPKTNTNGQDAFGMPPLEQFKALIKNWIAAE